MPDEEGVLHPAFSCSFFGHFKWSAGSFFHLVLVTCSPIRKAMATFASFSESAYFRIGLVELRALHGKERLVPLYTYFPQNGHLELRFESGDPVSLEQLELYRRNGIKHLWCPIEFKDEWEDSWNVATNATQAAAATPGATQKKAASAALRPIPDVQSLSPLPSAVLSPRPADLDAKLDQVKNEAAQDAIEALLAPEFKPRERQVLLASIATQLTTRLRGLGAEDSVRIDQVLTSFQNLTDEIVQALVETQGSREVLAAVAKLKEMVPQHSGVCSSLSLILAMGLGHTDRTLLVDLSVAATLHDLGLCRISPELISKNWDELSAADSERFAAHVQQSLQMIDEKGIQISARSKTWIAQHHERFDGQGFPMKLKGDELSEFSQLLSLVDQMDDWMSGKRGYRRHSPIEALGILKSSTAFRPGLVDSVILLFGGDLQKLLIAHPNPDGWIEPPQQEGSRGAL